ncbi:MAG: hypothetical protein KJ063_23860 [Anaerolineae bacterium]|nr:hypothetical protein [Anaerolineae bacterium]
MGGYGSTRWNFHTKKETVEDCRALSISDLKREGVLQAGVERSGSWIWRNAYTNEYRASIGYELNTLGRFPYLRLHYTITRWDGNKRDMDYHVRLETTPCNYGGVRWWFICPLVVNGRSCEQRVGKLFLAPGSLYFGCRHCHDLTYRSSQENDKRVNALKRLGPLAILQGMNSGEIDTDKGFKALPPDIWRL